MAGGDHNRKNCIRGDAALGRTVLGDAALKRLRTTALKELYARDVKSL